MLYTQKMIDTKYLDEGWRDVTWYCVDKLGHIAVVCSGGGVLPTSVTGVFDELSYIDNYFETLPIIANKVSFLKHYRNALSLLDSKLRALSAEAMNNTVSRGIYCFDKTKVMVYNDFEYHLKAKPNIPLTVHNIDKKILHLIERTIVNKDFETDQKFYVNEVE